LKEARARVGISCYSKLEVWPGKGLRMTSITETSAQFQGIRYARKKDNDGTGQFENLTQ
jgi:hypothetical protein